MILATRRFEFSAAHRYWRDDWSLEENRYHFGPCISQHGHGHNYTLDVSITGSLDPRTGMLINMTELKALVGEVLEEFDHKHLNLDTPYFHDQIPTTENIVRVLWRLIAARLPTHVRLAHLRLYEMNDLWADYDGCDETTFARAYTFATAHRLHAPALSDAENHRIYGKCNNLNGHGHNYTLEVSIAGIPDPETGMVIDLPQMDAMVRAVLDQFDFHHIDHDVPAFADRPSTAEHIVVYLWDKLVPCFAGQLRHLKLWETRKNVFEYSGQ
ncbi:MAG: 6-pyruvoyl tetrahydropterin synthase [Oscillochloris sp.]|nr:6-pyruvoyl tetrahydropterin synthase [Oscillochloris sp.]